MNLFLTEGHKDDRDEEVEHHKRHKHDTGADEEGTQDWVVIKNLSDNKKEYNMLLQCHYNDIMMLRCSYHMTQSEGFKVERAQCVPHHS